MAITFTQLTKHLSQQNKWQGFGACTFEPKLLTVTQTLGCLNAWSKGKATIRDYVKTTGHKNLPDAAIIKGYAENFRDGTVILVAFSLGTFGAIWPREYPGATGDDLVIWDGHHRTSALAIREAAAIKDDHPVIVFVGS